MLSSFFRGVFAACITVLGLVAAPVRAQVGPSLGLVGGVTIPTSTYGTGKKAGYHLGLALHVPIQALPVEFRVDGNFTELKYSSNSTKAQIWVANTNLVLKLPINTAITTYGVGGVGVYNTRNTIFLRNNASTYGGVNAGGGLRFAKSGRAFFLEARYHRAGGATGIRIVPITLGLMF